MNPDDVVTAPPIVWERLGQEQLRMLWKWHKGKGLRPAQVDLLFFHIMATSGYGFAKEPEHG